MNPWPRRLLAALAALAAASVLAWMLLIHLLHAPRSHVAPALAYLAGSALVAVLAGALLMLVIARFVPSLGLKIWSACIAGSVATMVVVLYTPYMMFQARADFDLLRISLLYSLFISLILGLLVAALTTRQVGDLARAAARLSSGEFGTRVPVHGSDEIATLAHSFNSMSADLGDLFGRRQRLDQERRDLIAAVSHDLRTPLTSIRAMVEAINDGVVTDPGEVRRYLHLVQGETERMGRLIDDLFELSRIESGSLDLRLNTVPLAELVQETVEAFRPQAEERGIALSVSPHAHSPVLMLDGPRMQRVLSNLLQNALRHTPRGGEVRVDVRPRGAGAQVIVTDTGEGIPISDQELIFDQFYRGEKSRSRESGGAGLGLAIARGIVEAHRGSIKVVSVPGEGARFVVTL